MNKATDGNQASTQSSGDNRGSNAQETQDSHAKLLPVDPSAAVTTETLPSIRKGDAPVSDREDNDEDGSIW